MEQTPALTADVSAARMAVHLQMECMRNIFVFAKSKRLCRWTPLAGHVRGAYGLTVRSAVRVTDQ